MNGIIVINKQTAKTSRDIVNELNKIFHTKKIGHTGTLDPIATGVLVCCIGKYTKLVDQITSYDKEYITEIKLGIKTDTLDITGEIIKKNNFKITIDEINKVIKQFPKTYFQTVPKYSAIKIKGKKLYEYARNNIPIELPKREVNIYNIELLNFTNDIIKLKLKVSKGTYIRSFIEDFCSKLNTIGTMYSLERIKQGNFSILNSYTIDDIKNNNYHLLTIKDILDCEIININKSDHNYKLIKNGAKLLNLNFSKKYVLFLENNQEIALYQKKEEFLKPVIIF
ncbi:MAG: tRNA pseudouridine(55) synthase TruB [Firmicutes bacterium]|nr:tRNA pseudouridine(55) synthase TruB [Bacillota bacterium]